MPWAELIVGAATALGVLLTGTGVAAIFAGHRPPRGLAGAADVNARVDAARKARAL